MEFDPSRRKFIDQAMATIGAGIVGVTFGPIAYRATWDAAGERELERKAERILKHLQERYGTNLHLDFTSDTLQVAEDEAGINITMHELSSPYLRFKAAETLVNHLSKYPPEIVRRNIEELYIVDRFEHERTLFQNGQTSTGISVDVEGRKTVIVEVLSIFRDHYAVTGNLLPRTELHHEMGHKILGDVTEEEWTAHNPNQQYVEFFWKQLALDDEMPEGFATPYGRANWREDMATVAEALYLSYEPLMERCRTDQVLARKVAFIKERYARASSGKLGERYWDDLNRGRVNEAYWNQ